MPAFILICSDFINADRIVKVEVISPANRETGYRIHFANSAPLEYTDTESVRAIRSYLMNNLLNKQPLTAADFPNH